MINVAAGDGRRKITIQLDRDGCDRGIAVSQEVHRGFMDYL